MAKYTQTGHPLSVTTPLGKDALLLEAFSGREAVSELFNFTLHALSQDSGLDSSKILGQAVTVALTLSDGSQTYLSGVAAEFVQLGQTKVLQSAAIFTRYRLKVVPAFWLQTQTVNSKIFQQMSVPDILKQVLSGMSVSYQLQGTYNPRDYCAQYRESNFAFASRLMEEEGIYYYFSHTSSSHQMVIADTQQGFTDVPGQTTVNLLQTDDLRSQQDWVRDWQAGTAIRSDTITLWDYCFEMPDKNLAGTKAASKTKPYEIYEYQGGYAKHYDGVDPGGGDQSSDLQNIFTDNTTTAGVRLDEQVASTYAIKAEGNCRQFVSGHKFTLASHFQSALNISYVLTAVEHDAKLLGAYTYSEEEGFRYSNHFECLPSTVNFRPRRVTPRPIIAGPQTAVVVGPSGQEISTDKYGRVKVQFHWDRDGQNDQNSSCWVRVGTPWAGQQWGMVHIPRMGQEVIVAFEEGDPDQPIIVGSVYNADNMPPYTLPDNMTQSGLKSRSTLQGTADNFNELRFEDKKDNEQIYFHAEKDFIREVENNDSLTVGSDQADDGSQTIVIYNNRTETIQQGNESITIEKGNRTESINEGDESITLGKGSRTTSIKTDETLTVEGKRTMTITGDETLVVKSGNKSSDVQSGTDTIQAATSITLKVGSCSITIDTSGITIDAPQVTVQGSSQVAIKGGMVQIN